MLKKIAAMTAASLVLASSAATAQSAQSLSVSNAPAVSRAAANADGNQLEGYGAGVYLIGAAALGLLIWGILELLDDSPDSP